MKTLTLSVRLDAEEVALLDQLAVRDGVDRSALLKRFVRRGYTDYRYETACTAYRKGEVSLSRAAEMAGVSVHDLLAHFPEMGLQLNLTPDELRRELAT